MARKTSRRHAQGDASRRTILDATLRIAGERGYVGTTMSLVKKASGLPASSLYWHFESKDELLADALDHGFALWHERAPRWSTQPRGATLLDSVLAELRASLAGLDEEPGFWRMGLMLGLESGPAVGSGPRDRFQEIRTHALARLREWWGHALAGAGPELVATLAQLTLAALDGLYVRYQGEGAEDLDILLQRLAAGLADVATRMVAAGTTDIYPTPSRQPPPPPRITLSEPDSSRARLLEAAHRVAAESGYEGATISRICATAGLPASSLYWHFKDKDALFAEVVDHSYREWQIAQPAWLPPPPGTSWQDEVRSHMLVTGRSLVERPPFLRIGYMLLLLRRTEPMPGRDRFVAVRRRVQLLAATWFREVLGCGPSHEPERLAQLIMAIFDGLFFSACFESPWEPRVFADLLLGVLSAGLASADIPG